MSSFYGTLRSLDDILANVKRFAFSKKEGKQVHSICRQIANELNKQYQYELVTTHTEVTSDDLCLKPFPTSEEGKEESIKDYTSTPAMGRSDFTSFTSVKLW
ncbi:hypothetical protein ADUPG1_009461 [Aduncisulcus paluster]|uniref:Uncharacterized protein n=1 Tax=Aduncisulcus paluster TaxID=2918883 RepID=A0ABQ5KVQ4_9EUKA|nr:hypothetical protein ADUPG1_009461 [Aduncisulcus paluster]